MPNTHTTLTSLFTDIANKIRAKKGTSASIKADDFPSEIESIQTGITPSGTISITTTSPVDVTNYATAQVVDADLVASNIKKDVNILGVLGTFEGGGGGEWTFEEGEFTLAQGSRTATFALSKSPTQVKTIMLLAKTFEELSTKACCSCAFWCSEWNNAFGIFGDTASGSPGLTIREYNGFSFSGNQITYTTQYSYRPLPAADFIWKVVYK